MKKITVILVTIIILISIGCTTEKLYYSSEDILDPYNPNDDVVIPEKPAELIFDVEYTENLLWADKLSEYVPVFEKPKFHPTRGPEVLELPLEKGRISIKGESYHQESSELMFSWFADNLDLYGLMVNRYLPNNEDPLIYIPQDGSGSLQVTDGFYNLKIDITPLIKEPGWVKVTYDGSVLKK